MTKRALLAFLALAATFAAGLKLHDPISASLHTQEPQPPAYRFSAEFLAKHPPRGEIVFIGDSRVARVDWNALLGRSDVANFGISGDDAQGVLARVGPVLDSGARRAALLTGVNDIVAGRKPEDVAADVARVVERLATHMPVTLFSVIPAAKQYRKFNGEIGRLNALLRTACKERCSFITLDEVSAGGEVREDYALDGLHLNVAGYERQASRVAAGLQ